MARSVELPPHDGVRPDGFYPGGWWHSEGDEGRLVCDLCPRECHMKPGDRGFCFVRQNVDGEMMLTTYGKSTGFCIDPIEKKPLNHFLPGTSVLSFGTAGCNLGCKFCQNWDISKSREVERLSELAGPEAIAEAARHFNCRSVAYTYNDPVIWAEYAIDTAKACRAAGIKNVAVTAGYISPQARAPFYEYLDAANVDLKSFSEEFYYRITYSHLQPVLDTLEWLKRETDVWFEITNLVIPQANDGMDEIRQMSDWILDHVGDGVPVHFTAFHPDFRMRDRPNTPPETLIEARSVALQQGLKFVYVGNVNDVVHQSTYCPKCHGLLIQRNWYELGEYHLRDNRCGHCEALIPGVFETQPGNWGRKRLPVRISDFARPLPILSPTPSRTEEPRTMTETAKTEGSQARLKAQRPKLGDEQQKLIHHAACELVAGSVLQRPTQIADPTLGGSADRTVMGSFVTLKRQGRLRACCGELGRPMPLAQALQQAAVRTATEDSRLPTISPTELEFLDLDVSLLFGFTIVSETGEDRIKAVEVGRHGLQISRGENAGLLLPSVATEQGYTSEEFLRQVCRKAGLPTTAWQDAQTQLQTFETVSIAGEFDRSTLEQATHVTEILTAEELSVLAAHCGQNIAAIVQGATPSYYVPGVSDGNVNGITLTIRAVEGGDPIHLSRVSMRPAMALQSTLYNICESAASALRTGRIRLPGNSLQVALSLLHDPAMNGTVTEPDLRGIDPQRRALLVQEAAKSAWIFDPEKSGEQLLKVAAEEAHVFNAESASVFSFAVQSTEKSITVGNSPKPAVGPAVRPAAVAGRFYPADPNELNEMVDRYLAKSEGAEIAYPAIMVPHAGLVYSGSVAGRVFAHTKIPDTVIVVSPKHTRAGVDWAVAPHESWTIPGAQIPSDRGLAQQLCEAIDGLEMDAAAHQGEHGIEVELPFLHRLNPNVKVVGIAIGAGDVQRCRDFAEGLVQVLKGRDDQPLLVISSDMNHYAPDDENRRLDEIAMQSLERLDPEEVYQTVTGHGISMCGVLPAVMIMEAVQKQHGLKKAERIAYATSADASGDKSRVVGYCGMTFA
jgi:AmmeMemoRadiSam system radical SAM enzyme/AmmeMemoRadiSam system protein B/AmmeMemoRadiSam system protein A